MKNVRRPSPALVIACIALVAALGGTAIAGGVINGKKAKNIANKQITKRAPGLSVANAANAEDVMWAVVNNPAGAGNATLTRGDPSGVTVNELTGVQVRFPRSVQTCAWNATNGLSTGGAASPGWAQVNATADPNVVEVRTRDDAGIITDQPFHLVVTC
ncbi:MAG: hypothetical protein ACXWEA_08380 [Solirubrobacterales bacterium]